MDNCAFPWVPLQSDVFHSSLLLIIIIIIILIIIIIIIIIIIVIIIEIRDLLTSHMSKVCRNVETEPLLQPLDDRIFNLQSTVTSRKARLDIKAGGFWTPGVTACFDVRVTHVNSRSNQGKHTAMIFKEQENEKKRKYNQRMMDVEMGTFTPLVAALLPCYEYSFHLLF